MIKNFKNWERLNEQKGLDVDPKKSKKLARKQNKRKFRKEDYVSDSGASYSLIRQKDDDETKDTFVLKGKGKDSPVWNEDGKITNDVNDFLNFELFSGENEGKYDKESIEMEKYREGKRRDKVTFTVSLIDQEKVEAEKEAETKKKEEEETKKKAEEAKKIVIPANEEGENRIEIGQTSPVLPQIKELIRKAFVKKGFKMGSAYGMDWLDSDKLEEKDAVWVKALRAGFGMKLVDFISQGLVDKIVNQVAEWEKPAEEEEKEEATAANESRIFNFSNYLRMLEQFDIEAAMKQMQEATPKEKPAEQKTAAGGSGGSGGSAPSTGFSQEEGDKFRQWANSTDELKKKYGKSSKYDLDATGKPDNSFIRKAYAAAKDEYEASEGDSKVESGSSELKKSMQADYEIANAISNKLVEFWKSNPGAGIFKPYKGVLDDEEDKALKGAYEPWLTSSGIRKQLAKIKNPYYKETITGVIQQTKVEMTDIVPNSVSWTLLNPSKLDNVADEGLKQLATYEPPAKTWIGSDLDFIGNRFAKFVGYKPEMSRYAISGPLFNF